MFKWYLQISSLKLHRQYLQSLKLLKQTKRKSLGLIPFFQITAVLEKKNHLYPADILCLTLEKKYFSFPDLLPIMYFQIKLINNIS